MIWISWHGLNQVAKDDFFIESTAIYGVFPLADCYFPKLEGYAQRYDTIFLFVQAWALAEPVGRRDPPKCQA